MNSALAFVALAAFCATAIAAPFGSPSDAGPLSPAHRSALVVPADRNFEAPAQARTVAPDVPGSPRRNVPLVVAAFSAVTAIAFSTIFLAGHRSLHRRHRRGRRIKRVRRSMAYLC